MAGTLEQQFEWSGLLEIAREHTADGKEQAEGGREAESEQPGPIAHPPIGRQLLIEEASYDFHAAVVRKIDGDRTLLQVGWDNMAARIERNGYIPRNVEWSALIGRPWGEIREALLEKGQAGVLRRCNAPFAGVLTMKERQELFERTKARLGERARDPDPAGEEWEQAPEAAGHG